MVRRTSVAFVLALTTFCAVASAAPAPGHNSGYGWWPGGNGYPPLTVNAANQYPCSATAYGPTFNNRGTSYNQDYGGGTSCAGGMGSKQQTVYTQVLGQDNHTWYTISGSTVTTPPTEGNPVHVIRNRPAFLGHAYRVVVVAHLVVPNGHAGCSIDNTCSQAITITAISRSLAP